MFPLILYQEGTQLPSYGTYFVVAANGYWLHKDTGIVKAFVPVDRISILQDLDAESWVQCNLPKIPAKLVWQIKHFFKEVTDQFKTEVNVILYFNKQDQSYKIVVPQQNVSHGGVAYRRESLIHDPDMVDYLRVGTIHSHCDFGAFHSGTDQHDETDFDGLHCTFGNNHLDDFTIVASVVVNGHRLMISPLNVLEGVEHIDEQHFRLLSPESKEWLTDIREWFHAVQTGVPVKWCCTSSLEAVQNMGTENVDDPPCPAEVSAIEDVIVAGDKVEWAGDLTTVSFRSICGEGPFVVESVADNQVTVATNVGLARFSEKLFKRAT